MLAGGMRKRLYCTYYLLNLIGTKYKINIVNTQPKS